ncbi:unnamed protein product [marine sediment metagenome]|uniref:Uncharacterized protein n=1 Tax=marine sediment metagenome TaxID=412755 RepID=X0WKH4_9ZZZZ
MGYATPWDINRLGEIAKKEVRAAVSRRNLGEVVPCDKYE